MTKREKFGVVMQTLAETYGRQTTPLMLEGYWMALSDLPEAELAAAAKLALRTCRYMPTPADIRVLLRDVRANGLAASTTRLLAAQRNVTPATAEQIAEIRRNA